LAKGLDKDGLPFRPISEETKKHRRSAMTPSGRGDPNAPPLIPGWQKSRTRSLLTGKALADRAEFWWKYDAITGDSWARILEAQRAQGRDAFGLSPKAMARVKAQAWERWNKWRVGRYEEPVRRVQATPKPARAGSYRTGYLDLMGGHAVVAAGRHSGFKTPEEWEKYFRQAAKASLPGRPLNPKVMSPISGPRYTRGLQYDWAKPGGSGGAPGSPGSPTPANAPKPKPSQPAYATHLMKAAPGRATKATKSPVAPSRFADHAAVESWAKGVFPNATVNVEGIPLESWHVIANEVDHLSQKYADVFAGVVDFGAADRVQKGAIAWVKHSNAGAALKFAREEWAKLSKVDKAFQSSATNGWIPKNVGHAGPGYFVTHEVGHLADEHMRKVAREKYLEVHRVFKEPNGYQFDPLKGQEVSEYGATNELEAVAEAFAGARWRTDSENPKINQIREAFGL